MARNFNVKSTQSTQAKFAHVPSADIKRSRFNRSHGLKTTFGRDTDLESNPLVPIFWDEVLPGDSFHLKATSFARLATPLHPFMDNLFVDTHFFFVPYRLLWSNFQILMGEKPHPNYDIEQTVPQVRVPCTTNGDPQADIYQLCYYFGLPMTGADDTEDEYLVSSLPFRAYRLIWNEWYRDENIQIPMTNFDGNGPDPQELSTTLAIRNKRKDYFTSALPWPQKGDPVLIPVDLQGYVDTFGLVPTDAEVNVTTSSGADLDYTREYIRTVDDDILVRAGQDDDYEWDNVVNAATINDLRTAFQIQKMLERDARGGTRYTEILQAHFNVHSPDARLQRPEYLGGGSSRIGIQPVPVTGGLFPTSPNPHREAGELGAYGTSINTAKFSKSFTEHGIIIGLASYRSDLTYQRGIERFWSRQTRYDFFWPALAHLGEQAILNKELNFHNIPDDDNAVFGYQERFAEYRYKPSRVTGLFNSDAVGTLDAWHLAQDFSPTGNIGLNSFFIEDRPPIDRIIAVPSEPYIIMDCYFDLMCDRPMPTWAVPGFVDHF